MSESQLFVSSCSKRELAKRRGHSWPGAGMVRISHPALTALLFVAVCVGAFIAGRGGI